MPIPRNAAGDVLIEDYTKANTGMQRLRFALATGRQARIAVIGDSYIEGDILTGDLRRDLRKVYGGAGVGYMYMQSEIPGFRRTVRQTCSGWKQMDIRKTLKTPTARYRANTLSAHPSRKQLSRPPKAKRDGRAPAYCA